MCLMNVCRGERRRLFQNRMHGLRHRAVLRADYVGRYAKKGDAMPKHSMGDDSGSEEGSDADEKGFLSSRQVRAQLAGYGCISSHHVATPMLKASVHHRTRSEVL